MTIPADGVVIVNQEPDRWYHVQIGRPAGVKRFNLRESEARQLVEQLSALLPKTEGPPFSGGPSTPTRGAR